MSSENEDSLEKLFSTRPVTKVPAPRRRLYVGDGGLTIALVAYFVMLTPGIYLLSKGGGDLSDVLWAELVIAGVGVAGVMSMWRDTLPLLGMPRIERPFDVLIAVAGLAGVLVTVYLVATLLPTFFLSDTLEYKLEGKTLSYAILHGAVVARVGTNTEQGVGTNKLGPDQWRTGFVLSPHGVAVNNRGDLFVSEFNATGRVHRFNRQ